MFMVPVVEQKPGHTFIKWMPWQGEPMTQPTPPTFTPVVPQEERKKENPTGHIPWMRVTELVTPRGVRPGKLLIVRPIKQIEDFRKKDQEGWKGTLVVADVACLDPIEAAMDEYGMELPGFPPGHQFRDQVVFPGYLNGAFRSYCGNTLIGTVFLGPNTKGKPPIMWRDLSADASAVARGQQFFMAHPEFLIPVEGTFQSTEPGQATTSSGQPAVQQGYQQPDPWATAPQSPAAPQPTANTLEQLKQYRETNHHGQPQAPVVPF
jgi:hypothetical protein